MAQNLTDNWQIDKILTDNWHLQPPIQTLYDGKDLTIGAIILSK